MNKITGEIRAFPDASAVSDPFVIVSERQVKMLTPLSPADRILWAKRRDELMVRRKAQRQARKAGRKGSSK